MSRRNNSPKLAVKKDSGKIHLVNMSSYTRPEVKEVQGDSWIEYGEDNDYFQYLIDRYNGSATNNAAINGIVEMIYGKGLDCLDAEGGEYTEEKSPLHEEALKLLNKKAVRRACYDFKIMGQCALQIIYSKDRTKIVEIAHMPVESLRAEKAVNGEVRAYYYSPDWKEVKKYGKNKPKRIPAFGFGNKKDVEIFYIKPYRAGYFYYSPTDYQGGLQYAELEEEMAMYHISNIQNGLAPSMLINFNNGVPSESDRKTIEKQIHEKFSGSSNAGKFILAFNDSKELAANIEPIILSDASEQYTFLSEESRNKIMVSHRIVSGMLVGIKESTGLGNNAEELQTSSTLMDNVVIRPLQTTLLDAFEEILEFNGMELELYFKTLQPLEFTDLTNALTDEEIEKETGQKSSTESVTEEEIEI
jgi:hypothetical protein